VTSSDGLVDAGSFFEIKPRWAEEIVVGLGRLDGQVVGIVANQPQVRSGAIFVDSADKAARFITMCDAFNVPLIFLHDVPGFMVGAAVERQGIIRHGAKMITAMASRRAHHAALSPGRPGRGRLHWRRAGRLRRPHELDRAGLPARRHDRRGRPRR